MLVPTIIENGGHGNVAYGTLLLFYKFQKSTIYKNRSEKCSEIPLRGGGLV